MRIPYRTARILKRAGIIALVNLLVACVVFLCWFLWLQRFVVYTRDQGAKLDLTLSQAFPNAQAAVPPEPREPVSIYYNEGENAINISKELTQFVGYYADQAALEESLDAVLAQVKALPKEAAVMVDVKSPKGSFFYSSAVGEKRNSDIDTAQMDGLIEYLADQNVYAIARLPAFRDYEYGLNHVPDGLPTSGGFLWADDDYCYWLDPTSQGTLTYLLQIVSELKALGFDEVVFEEFRFPDTDRIVFEGDKNQALLSAAATLVSAGADSAFAVSFVGQSPDFPLPEGRSRLYLENISAADAAKTAAQTGIADPAQRLVFLAEVHDTRFDVYSVLRPLDAAH